MGRRGVTVVELLVVMLILAVLAGALYQGFSSSRQAAVRSAACQFGGTVYLTLVDKARELLRNPDSVLYGLGLPTAGAPPGKTGIWYDCGAGYFGTPPSGTVCRAGVENGQFAVYTWLQTDASRVCLNGRR